MSVPGIQASEAHPPFDGSCNCCHAKESISRVSFDAGNASLVVRLCPPCLGDAIDTMTRRKDELTKEGILP